ncbi:TRM11 family SAM-dependent methyltransferase [Streptomyces iconiensis]|uniref:Methyltransferase n=1 Tax=Streptomyces iconiensis TaxID=1384038 RepID=A0ABT6ZZL7_9ACTN|nr:DNA methyltransferase [Streptomyces iconiensis]MDJ1134523.1 DNA methyltransferase [Streptomyces iconiensis]
MPEPAPASPDLPPAGLSVWNTAPTSAPHQRRARHYVPGSADHPAKMLPALAAHAIRTYSRPGELVMDPMCGIGTTLIEAQHLGRHALGIEYEARWAHLAALNAATAPHEGATGAGEVYWGDARHLTGLIPTTHHGRIALVLTSPPYGRSLHGQVRSTRESGTPGVTKRHYRYSNDPHNLAHAPTDQLLDAFTDILTACHAMLRPGGITVVVTRPWRDHGELIDLPTAVLGAGRRAGLIPIERNVALLAGIRDSRLVPRPSFFQLKYVRDARRCGTPLHLIVHEDVIVFRKLEHETANGRRGQPHRPASNSNDGYVHLPADHAPDRTHRSEPDTSPTSSATPSFPNGPPAPG